ncbi:RNA-directed DNA polymerase, eukaryota, partial [Tanacetum coccineum]
MSDMTAFLNDLSYIPLNNEQNEPTQGILGEHQSSHTQRNELGMLLEEYGARPKSSGKDIDVYLRPLIDDLKDLWAKPGVETIDVATGLKFNMRAMKVIWYVLHNSPEIDTYRAKFKSEFPNKDMKEAFPGCFGKQIRQRHIDNDPGVSESSELFALACGPSQTPISVNSYVVNGVRFVVHSRDERRTTQNSDICSPSNKGRMKTVLFRVKWFDTSNKGRMKNLVIRNNITQIKANGEAFKNDQYILATQVKQCFYLEDMARRPLGWKVVEHVSHKKFLNEGVIVVEDDPDVIHIDNSSDLALFTNDDIIDEEDPIPHDLAYSDDEDLVNLDIDDGVNVVYS